MDPNERLFDALADRQRRQLLLELFQVEPRPVPKLSGASREILAANDGYIAEYLSTSMEIADVDKEAVRAHHVHLPKLVTYRYVEREENAPTVRRGADFDDLRPHLQLLDDQPDGASGGATPLILQRERR